MMGGGPLEGRGNLGKRFSKRGFTVTQYSRRMVLSGTRLFRYTRSQYERVGADHVQEYPSRLSTYLSRYVGICWVRLAACKLVPPSTVPRLGDVEKLGKHRSIPCYTQRSHVAPTSSPGSMCVWAAWSDIAVVLMGPWITRGRQAHMCQMHHLGNCKRMERVWDKLYVQ